MAAGNVFSIPALGLSSGIPQCIVLNGQIVGQIVREEEEKVEAENVTGETLALYSYTCKSVIKHLVNLVSKMYQKSVFLFCFAPMCCAAFTRFHP